MTPLGQMTGLGGMGACHACWGDIGADLAPATCVGGGMGAGPGPGMHGGGLGDSTPYVHTQSTHSASRAANRRGVLHSYLCAHQACQVHMNREAISGPANAESVAQVQLVHQSNN